MPRNNTAMEENLGLQFAVGVIANIFAWGWLAYNKFIVEKRG